MVFDQKEKREKMLPRAAKVRRRQQQNASVASSSGAVVKQEPWLHEKDHDGVGSSVPQRNSNKENLVNGAITSSSRTEPVAVVSPSPASSGASSTSQPPPKEHRNITVDISSSSSAPGSGAGSTNSTPAASPSRKRPHTSPASSSPDANVNGACTSEIGVIQEVYCENFMCHRKLRVELSPHVNFITGENGSGKSAIIAAVQICLGASARTTHRGKSIKNLIRHGHDGNALVRITIRNDADSHDAFRPNEFGNSIIIERLIRRDGTAEYRLKNERGQLVSKSKMDLEALLDHLNIQTENPCAILDQENAKLFLKGNASDKYKFFLQSTDLFKMRNIYSRINEDVKVVMDVLKREQSKLGALQEVMEEARQRYEEAQSIGHLEQEFAQVKKALAWSFVCEKEREAAETQREIKQQLSKLTKLTCELDEANRQVAKFEAKYKAKDQGADAISQRSEELQNRQQEIKMAIREIKRPLQRMRMELSRLDEQKTATQTRIQRIERAIEVKRRDHEHQLQRESQQHARMRQQIDQMKNRLSRVQQEVQQADQEREQYLQESQGRLGRIEDDYEAAVRTLEETDHELRRVQERANSLRSQKRDRMAMFGPKIPLLHQEIQRNLRRFTKPPIGPIGMFVKLPTHYKHLSLAIELSLKNGTLQSFLVENGRDKKLLDDIKRRVQCGANDAPIIICTRSNGQRYQDLRLPRDEDLQMHTVAKILEIEDNDVFNTLVDLCNIENKLMFNDRPSAEQKVLLGSSGSFRMPSGVAEAFLPSGDKFYVRGGNLTYVANKGQKKSRFIGEDVASSLHELDQRIEYLQGKRNSLRQEVEHLRHARESLIRDQKRHEDRSQSLQHERFDTESQLNALESQLHESTQDSQQEQVNTSALEEELAASHQDLVTMQKREAELTRELNANHPEVDKYNTEMNELTAEWDQLQEEAEDLKKDGEHILVQLREAKHLQARYDRHVQTVDTQLKELQERHVALVQESEDFAEKTKRLLGSEERVQVEESQDFYRRRLADIQRRIEKERNRFEGMDLDDLLFDKEEKAMKFEKKKFQIERFTRHLNMLREMLHQRQEYWHSLRTWIASRTNMEFNKYMNLNDFAGKLKFDHNNQRLEINVLHNEQGVSKKNSKVTDMKELSGGERSYTQVSLLLALGDSIECPFRVMDEFDVFMDSMNRDMTIQLLVRAAKRDGRKQFIFVTPNDLSTLKSDPMVKIQKMNPPRDRLNAAARASQAD